MGPSFSTMRSKLDLFPLLLLVTPPLVSSPSAGMEEEEEEEEEEEAAVAAASNCCCCWGVWSLLVTPPPPIPRLGGTPASACGWKYTSQHHISEHHWTTTLTIFIDTGTGPIWTGGRGIPPTPKGGRGNDIMG